MLTPRYAFLTLHASERRIGKKLTAFMHKTKFFRSLALFDMGDFMLQSINNHVSSITKIQIVKEGVTYNKKMPDGPKTGGQHDDSQGIAIICTVFVE
jgi:hypothetical protein